MRGGFAVGSRFALSLGERGVKLVCRGGWERMGGRGSSGKIKEGREGKVPFFMACFFSAFRCAWAGLMDFSLGIVVIYSVKSGK